MNAPTLVVGGTGILAPVAVDLARARPVLITSRRPERHPAGFGAPAAVRFNGHHPGASLPSALAEAVVYMPAVADEVLMRLAARVSGRLVLVFPSGATLEPEASAARRSAARTGAAIVLLGWAGPVGCARWHSPAEIAPGVLAAVHGRPMVRIGRLTPWSDRPGWRMPA